MRPSRELQVIILDDSSKTLEENANRISKEIGLSLNTCRCYLSAKRNGYETHSHRKYITQQKYFENSMAPYDKSAHLVACESFENDIIQKEIWQQFYSQFENALMNMSKNRKRVLTARLDGETFKNIGKKMNKTHQATRQLYHKTIASLKSKFKGFVREHRDLIPNSYQNELINQL